MKKTLVYTAILLLLLVWNACSKEEEKDVEKPEINLDFAGAFPVSCDTLYIGESFTLRAEISDNLELGSYSVDIHHNFNHHSHSTEAEICPLDDDKAPVNPLLYLESFTIETGQSKYMVNQEITVPEGVDEGDYHFYLAVTDVTGWQTIKILAVKLVEQ